MNDFVTDYRIDAVGLWKMLNPLYFYCRYANGLCLWSQHSRLGGHPVFHVTYTHRDSQRLASFATGGRVDGSSMASRWCVLRL